VLSNKLPLQMSTQNYIRLRHQQLIPVVFKLVKQLTISVNINQVNSTAQRIFNEC